MLNNPVIIQAPQGDIKFPVYASTITVRNDSNYEVSFDYSENKNGKISPAVIYISKKTAQTLYNVLPGVYFVCVSVVDVGSSSPFVLADAVSTNENIITGLRRGYFDQGKYISFIGRVMNLTSNGSATITIT